MGDEPDMEAQPTDEVPAVEGPPEQAEAKPEQAEAQPKQAEAQPEPETKPEQVERKQNVVDDVTVADVDESPALATGPRKGCAHRLYRFEQCLDGCPCPPSIPPLFCLRKPGCANKCCEANKCCFCCGRLGFTTCGNFRKLLLLVSLFLSMVGVCLRAMPAAALSTDKGNLYAYPWAYGDYVCLQQDKCQGLEAKIYIGLESLLVESANYNTYKAIPWGADDCVENLSSLGAGSYCSICREASLGCAAMAFLSIACSLFNIWADVQRMRGKFDHNCIKFIAIVSNIVGALQLMLAVSIFQMLCVAEFPLEDADQTFRIDLTMGRGGALIASACGINVFNLVVHWAIQVPEARWKPDPSWDPAPSGYWPPLQQKPLQAVMPEVGVPVKHGWGDPAAVLAPVGRVSLPSEDKHRASLMSA